MATTTLRVTNIMTQDGAPASGVHPTDSSPDTSLATVGYVNTKISGVGELDTNISALQGKITNLQNQLNNIQSTALTRAQYGALKDQLTSDINQIVAAGDNSASQALKNLQDQLRQANANITTLNNRNSILVGNVNTLQTEKAGLERTITQLQAQVASLSGDVAKVANLESQVQTLNITIDSLRTQISTKDTQIADLTATVESLRNSSSGTQQDYANAIAEKIQLQGEKTILEARVTQLENEKITLTNTISELNNQLRDAQAGSGNSEALAAAQEQVRTLTADIQTKDAKIAELTLNVKQLQADLEAALERANGGQTNPPSSGTGQQTTVDGGFKGTTVGGIEFM